MESFGTDKQAGWSSNDVFGINIGSSRGQLIYSKNNHQEYLETGRHKHWPPTTTLGNISLVAA
jgi:hypothetical protein